jgi:nucleoside-diphosphate-sugar epimerase
MAYHRHHRIDTRIVRIFNTYGPRMRLNDGRALPAFIGQALRGEDLTVFGDGSQTRSFCYVDDLVEGIYRLLMSDYAQPVNVGNPDEISLKDFAEEIIKLTGTNQKIVYKPLPQTKAAGYHPRQRDTRMEPQSKQGGRSEDHLRLFQGTAFGRVVQTTKRIHQRQINTIRFPLPLSERPKSRL